jgi:hypothetical protein
MFFITFCFNLFAPVCKKIIWKKKKKKLSEASAAFAVAFASAVSSFLVVSAAVPLLSLLP